MDKNSDLLDPARLAQNVTALQERIRVRFEGHSIVKRADRLVTMSERAIKRSKEIARPRYVLRAFCLVDSVLLVGAVLGAAYFSIRALVPTDRVELMDFIQSLEAGIGCVIFLSIALLFFGTLEKRVRRRELITEIEILRNFLHLVNMGQLDKEPVRLEEGFQKTDCSPEVRMDARGMERYLSQTQKLAHYAAEIGCVYANQTVDSEVDRMADNLREFASDIARAAGDKITILELKVLARKGEEPSREPAPTTTVEATDS